MSNVIQIKRGASKPENQLAPYELGYVIQYNEDGSLNTSALENSGQNWAGHLFIGGPLITDEEGVKSYGSALPIKTTVEADAILGILPLEKGGTGVDSLYDFRQLAFDRGISSDLVSGWCAQGFSLHYIDKTNESIVKPSEEGFILNLSDYDTKVGQLWFDWTGGAVCRRHPSVDGWSSWIPLLDKAALSNGSLTYNGINSNEIYWAINLKSFYGLGPDGNATSSTNPPVGWGTGIKFHVLSTQEARWAGIAGYASATWANQTGIKLITSDAAGNITEATFAGGIFTTPIIESEQAILTDLNSNMITANIITVENINIIKDNKETNICQIIYPVGSIYMSVNSTSPAVLFGGTWEQLTDRFLVGAGGSFDEPGGSSEHIHTLSDKAYAKINHHQGNFYFKEVEVETYTTDGKGSSSGEFYDSNSETYAIPLGGVTDSASNLPPYLPVYMWKRIA